MKKVLLAFLLIALTLGVGSVVWAVIEGTPHDVKVITGLDDTDLEPCAMCHTPHKGTGAYPLWNRTQDAQTYTMYDSVSYDMDEGNQPQNPSTLCLVCHNGVASELVNYPGSGKGDDERYDLELNTKVPEVWGNLGTSMVDDHPISFSYNPAVDDTTDNNDFPTAVAFGAGRLAIPGNVTTGTAATTRYPLYNNAGAAPNTQFECPTCHSVHNTVDYGQGSSNTQVFFLRASNAGSKLCTDCHIAR